MIAFVVLASACDEREAEGITQPADVFSEADLPNDNACDDARKWPKARREQEAKMYAALAERRETGGTCPDARRFGSEPAPDPEGALICAARNFALYLEAFDNLGHVDGDGNDVVDRLADAGWDTLLATELVAAGDIAPERVLDEVWLPSAPHCNALRGAAWTHVGIGYIENTVPPELDPDEPMMYGAYWVVVLSAAER